MRKRARLLTSLALAAAIGTAGGACSAYADPADTPPGAPAVSGPAEAAPAAPESYGGVRGRIWDQIGLTDDQKASIKAVRQKYMPIIRPLARSLRAERGALRGLMNADVIDDAAIRTEASKMAAVEADLAVERAHLMNEIRGVLTPEQIQELRQAWKEARKGRLHKGQGRQ